MNAIVLKLFKFLLLCELFQIFPIQTAKLMWGLERVAKKSRQAYVMWEHIALNYRSIRGIVAATLRPTCKCKCRNGIQPGVKLSSLK